MTLEIAPRRLFVQALLALSVPMLGCTSDPGKNTSPATKPPTETQTVSKLSEDLPSLLEAAAIPGAAVAVVRDGVLELNTAVGTMDITTGTSVTADTVFEAASLSKPVVALRALQLVEEGQLDLDQPLTTYVDFERVTDDDRVHQITARHVLSHTTGFPNWARNRPLTIGPDPGTEFGYSGEGFVFLQGVIEQLTGATLDETVREHIFEPLGMVSSSFVWRPDYDTRSATGHGLLEEPRDKWKPDTANAAGSLHTTAADFARFLAEIADPTLLSSETVESMLTPQVEVTDGLSWGLGWGLEEVAGTAEHLYWHWGDNGAFRCAAMASPDRRLGVVYFTNSENGLSVAEEIFRRTLGDANHPWITWQDYPAYDSPAFQVQQQLLIAGIEGESSVLEAHDRLRKLFPGDAFSEELLNEIGYGLLRRRALDGAVAVLELNTQAFPESWNTYDSLGEALKERGEVERSIANYERSLELEPGNDNAVAMLKELRNPSPGP